MDAPEPAPRPHRRLVVVGVAVVVLAALFVVVGVVLHHRGTATAETSLRPAGIPADVTTATANEMALSKVPATAAPGFTLTDQAGHTRSLHSFKGRVVVLEFMDPHCTDICPIVSQEFVDAYHDLGSAARHVVFAAVNVNQYYAGVSSVAAFSHEHRLDTIPSWHFFTGPVTTLQSVWRAYGITVEAPHPTGDIVHTSIVYFIDPQGHERYVAMPQVDHHHNGAAFLPGQTVGTWGQGIATVAKNLAP